MTHKLLPKNEIQNSRTETEGQIGALVLSFVTQRHHGTSRGSRTRTSEWRNTHRCACQKSFRQPGFPEAAPQAFCLIEIPIRKLTLKARDCRAWRQFAISGKRDGRFFRFPTMCVRRCE